MARFLGSVLALALWVVLWMVPLNLLNTLEHQQWAVWLINFMFGHWTWGCLWAINHQSFHELKAAELPKLNREGLQQHLRHHKYPHDPTHLFVPQNVWYRLLALTATLSFGFTLLQLPGTAHWLGFCANFFACWLGMLSFMELYRLVHDRAHTQPGAEQRWWFPRSHVVDHHRHVKTHPGLYPIYEVLVRPGIVFYSAILRIVKRFNNASGATESWSEAGGSEGARYTHRPSRPPHRINLC